MEPLDEKQMAALRRVSGMQTVYLMMDISDFVLDLATKRGRGEEVRKLVRVLYGATRKLQ